MLLFIKSGVSEVIDRLGHEDLLLGLQINHHSLHDGMLVLFLLIRTAVSRGDLWTDCNSL